MSFLYFIYSRLFLDNNTNNAENNNNSVQNQNNVCGETPLLVQNENQEATTQEVLPSLDPEVLTALGELVPEQVTYGPDIHPDLALRWAPILKKGLTDKDLKEKIFSEYATPQNCKLFRAPRLNPEIAAAVSEFARARDKKIECSQQQLGVGLTAINRAMSLLLTSDNKVQAIKFLSDACRILSDLHALETQTRTKSLTQGLEKSFLNLIQESERDEMLFGSDLPEKIKASKAIEKQGSQIKKPELKINPGPSSSRSSRTQGNLRGSSRSTYRGGRGGPKKTQRPPISQSNFTPTRVWNRPPRAGPRT